VAGPAIGVMAKAPRPGAVKTRLIPALGAEGAARLARAFLEDSAALAARVASANHGTAFALVTPDGEAEAVAALTGLSALPQGEGDLGDRMVACFATLFERGHAPVLLIGADCPTLPERHLAEALALARRAPVFGPAHDGGYWGVALPAPAPALFAGITWGAATVLAETRAAAARAGLALAFAPPWEDIDEDADLAILARQLAEDGAAAPATRAALAELAFGR